MQWNTHGLNLLTVHLQGLQTPRDHRHRANETALAADLNAIAIVDAFCCGQRFADFNKLLRLGNGVKPRVLGPGVEVLRQTIGSADIREVLFFFPIRFTSSA